jgi:hypothetical protein
MKTRRLLRSVLAMVGVIALGGPIFAASPDAQVTQAVEGFYTAYLKERNAFLEGRAKKESAGPEKWQPHLTKNCYAAYLRLRKNPELDYDPLLQSNNVPEGFAVQKVRVDDDTAYVSAKYVGYVDTTPLLDLRLKRVDGQWLIDAIGGLNK